LAITTGLRQGELLGLKWDDVDLDTGTLRVRRTLTTVKGGPQLAAPKTKGSRRTVRLTQSAIKAFRSHPKRQLDEIDRVGSLWRENGLVFTSEVGDPLDRRNVTTTDPGRFSSEQDCRRYVSTTYGIRAPRCTSART
jgi:integrase